MRASSGLSVTASSISILTAKQLKEIMNTAAATAMREYPNDAEMRSRMFVATLSGSMDWHDKNLAERLRTVYQSAPEATGTPA